MQQHPGYSPPEEVMMEMEMYLKCIWYKND
jgi:hypothetical protein